MGIREVEFPMLPIGLTYIASALSDHEVKIFDPNCYPLSTAFEELEKEVARFRPDIAGISIRNIDTTNFRNKHIYFKTVLPTIQTVKAVNQDIKIIVGGSGFSLFPEKIMETIPEIDFGVYLEGEASTPELIRHLDDPVNVKGIYMRKNGNVFYTGDRDLPEFFSMPAPRMDPDVIDMTKYIGPSYNIIGIQAKRGCSLDCGYCSYPKLNGKRIRPRDPVAIVDQIEQMINNFGMKRFVFVDSVFNVPEQHARDILNEMIARKLNVEFGAWCHMKGVTEEFLQLLKRAGAVQVDFSPDAATNKGLKALKKGIEVSDILNTVKVARKVKGMGYGFGFFADLPGYNLLDVIKTWLMPFRIQFMLPGRGGGAISYIRIEPETHIQKVAIQQGLIDAKDHLWPSDETELMTMFYRQPSNASLNFLTDTIIALMERILKPAVVKAMRIVSRLMGKQSVYDQKTGFVAFKKAKK